MWQQLIQTSVNKLYCRPCLYVMHLINVRGKWGWDDLCITHFSAQCANWYSLCHHHIHTILILSPCFSTSQSCSLLHSCWRLSSTRASRQSPHQCPHYLWSRRAKAWGVGEHSQVVVGGGQIHPCRNWSQGKRPVYWKPFRWYWSLKSLYRISSMMMLPPSRTPSSGCCYPPNGGVPREKEYPSWRWYQVRPESYIYLISTTHH